MRKYGVENATEHFISFNTICDATQVKYFSQVICYSCITPSVSSYALLVFMDSMTVQLLHLFWDPKDCLFLCVSVCVCACTIEKLSQSAFIVVYPSQMFIFRTHDRQSCYLHIIQLNTFCFVPIFRNGKMQCTNWLMIRLTSS